MTTDEDFGRLVQSVAEAHLERCFEAYEEEQAGGPADDASFADFCGCVTCIVREVLTISYGLIEAHLYLQISATPPPATDQPER